MRYCTDALCLPATGEREVIEVRIGQVKGVDVSYE